MNRNSSPGLALLLAILLSAGAFTASAQDANPNVGRWYQVELILFEQRQEPEYNEIWPTFPDFTSTNGAQRLLKAPASDTAVSAPLPALDLSPPEQLPPRWPLMDLVEGTEIPLVLLPRPLLQLTEEARRVNESRGRRVLLHTGWNMPVAAEENPDVIRLHTGERFGDHFEVDGTLSIHVGRFLHVHTDLFQTRFEHSREPLPLFFGDGLPASLIPETERNPPLPAMVGQSPTFRMGPQFVPVEAAHFQEQRRMRSNELHYIDHPRLGLLIQFTPYTPVEITTGGELIEGDLDPEAEETLDGVDDDL